MTEDPKLDVHGRFKLLLKDGRIKTILGVLHIPDLARNLIFLIKMSNVGVHTIFEKDICKMVQGEKVLMMGSLVWNFVQTIRKHHY